MACRSTYGILSRNRPYVNKTPTIFVGFNEIFLGPSPRAALSRSHVAILAWLLFSIGPSYRFEGWLDAAVPECATVECERWGEDQSGEGKRSPDARKGTHRADYGPARDLSQRVCLAAHRDDGRPHLGVEPLVEPRQIQWFTEPSYQDGKPEGSERERDVAGQREGEHARDVEGVQGEERTRSYGGVAYIHPAPHNLRGQVT